MIKCESDNEESEEDGKRNVKLKGCSDAKHCGFCGASYPTFRDLRKHKKEKHADKLNKTQCEQCGYETYFKDGMTQHKKYHDAPAHWSTIRCDYCAYIYCYDPATTKERRAQQQLNTHLNDEHANLKLKCENCDKSFWTEKMLRVHTVNCLPAAAGDDSNDATKVSICSFCDFKASNAKGTALKEIRQHKKEKHRELLETIQCEQCSFVTHWKDSMALHQKYHELPVEWTNMKCEHCDYIYAYNPNNPKSNRRAQQQINGHMNDEHAQLKIKCEHCEKTFWSEKKLQTHLLSHEYRLDEEGFYHCDHCEFKCKVPPKLRYHINSVHLGVKPHLCDHCPAAFPNKGALNKHIQHKHTGERNFPCMFCEKRFHSKHNLVTHVRTHTGEKPFTCEQCGKSFADQAYFATHKRTHSTDYDGKKVKDFRCELCDKSFSRKCYLKNHMTGHANNAEAASQKRVKFTHEYKMAALQRVKIVGLHQTAIEMKINKSTLGNWINLTLHPYTCTICDKGFPYKSSLHNHMLTHPEYKQQHEGISQPNEEMQFKQEVSMFAMQNSISQAATKYNMPVATVHNWVNLVNDPKCCCVCGKEFSSDAAVRRHIEAVHKNMTAVGKQPPRKVNSAMQNGLTFAEFLAENNMLPSEEEVRQREEMLVQKEREKLELASVARDMFEKEKQRWELEKLKKEEDRINAKKENEKINQTDYIASVKNAFKIRNDDTQALVDKIKELKRESNDVQKSTEDQNTNEDIAKIEVLNNENDDDVEDFKNIDIKSEQPSEAEEDVGDFDHDFEPNLLEPSTCLKEDQEDMKATVKIDLKAKTHNKEEVKEEPSDSESIEEKPKVKKKKKKLGMGKKRSINKAGLIHECSFCHKKFMCASTRDNHEKVIHIGDLAKNCEFCGTQFKEGCHMQEHQLRKHWQELEEKTGVKVTVYNCEHCQRQFRVRRDYDRHLQVSHGPGKWKRKEAKHICGECGKRFTRLTYLRYHEAKIHGTGTVELKYYNCPQCEKVYHTKDHLKSHIKRIHDQERLQCDICSKLLSDRSTLNRHMLYHGEPQFQCNECPEKFREPRYLRRHQKVHTGELADENVCEFCSKRFTSLHSLRNHQLMYHGDNDEDVVCPDCGKSFKTARLLKTHQRVHTASYQAKRYCCDFCGNEYKSTAALQSHVNTVHLGKLANFPCEICGKVFSRANTLRTHRKIHDGIKQFNCLYCNSAYGEKRNLMNHIAKNHPGMELKFKRVTPQGIAILDEKNNLHNTSLIPVEQFHEQRQDSLYNSSLN